MRQHPSNPGCCVKHVMSSALGDKSSTNFQMGALSLQHRLSRAVGIGSQCPHVHLISKVEKRRPQNKLERAVLYQRNEMDPYYGSVSICTMSKLISQDLNVQIGYKII